jgi:selenide,water dikinase
LKEMLKETLGVEIYREKLPYFREAIELASTGFLPGGLYRNRDFYREHVATSQEDFFYDIIFDPQTSGCLLIAVDPTDIEKFAEKATQLNVEYWTIGKFVADPKGKIILV